MSGESDQRTDEELLAVFENQTLPQSEWNHRTHVRIAFSYACRHDLNEAICRMRNGLRALNTVHGTPETVERGYHETITVAFMRLIQAASRGATRLSSTEFCDRNPLLLSKLALQPYYSHDRLRSWPAKTEFLEPDLAPLPE